MQQLIEAVNASNATTFLDWAPIILSVISVLIAVYIPVKLARKENQIAIFEKLYAARFDIPQRILFFMEEQSAVIQQGDGVRDLVQVAGDVAGEEYGVGFRKGSDLVDAFNSFWAEKVADGTVLETATTYGLQDAVILE